MKTAALGTFVTEAELKATVDREIAEGRLVPPTQAEAMFNHAAAFHHAAMLLHKAAFGETPPRIEFFAPFVVNCALASELFLKTISFVYGNKQRGHELLTLYLQLPRRAKSVIDKLAPPLLQSRGIDAQTAFRTLLVGMDRAFEEWRYSFEKEAAPMIRVWEAAAAAAILHTAADQCVWPGERLPA